MSQEKPDQEQVEKSRDDPIIASALDVFSAALGLGAALARTVAEATAGGKPIPEPARNAGPVNIMVHYSVAAATNVIRAALSGALQQTAENARADNGSLNVPAAEVQPAEAATAAVSPMPTVRRGASLRIPLSIENPTPEPMIGLSFSCQAMKSQLAGTGRPLTEQAVRFEPTSLDISPRDFEKLTVFIDTEVTTAPGLYEAVIGLDSGGFETGIRFQVIPETVQDTPPQ